MSIEGVTGFQAATGDVALLVDGENLARAHAGTLLCLARKLGQLRVARVYGRFTHLGDWHTEPGFSPIFTNARPQAADLQIAIDAVAMAHAAGVRSFVIASDDRDFAALAFHLREAGCTVLGAGTAKAPDGLREAFSRFEIVGITVRSIAASDEPPQIAELPIKSKLSAKVDIRIKSIVAAACAEKNAVAFSSLGNMLKSAGLTSKQLGHSKWQNYFSSHTDWYRLSGAGAGLTLHIKDRQSTTP